MLKKNEGFRVQQIKISNNKSQISNKSQWPKFKIPNNWRLIFFEIWILEFICNLVLGIWDFRFYRA